MSAVILWVLVGYIALGVVVTIAMVGKERQPTTPGVAVGATIVGGLIIVGLIYVALNL